MMRTLVLGTAVGIAVGLLVLFSPLGLEPPFAALLGVSLGAVLASVPDRRPWQRVLAFLAGGLLTWGGYLLRVQFLPDSPEGRAVAALAIVLALTLVLLATVARLPLWAGLLGVAGVVGSYELGYVEDPVEFFADSTAAAATLALTTGIGYLLMTVLEEIGAGWRARRRRILDIRAEQRRVAEAETTIIDLPQRDRRSEV